MTGPPNTSPIITDSTAKEKRCTTPVTVTYFGHNDSGKLEKVFLPSKQPLSLITTDIDLEEHEMISLSPKNSKSPQQQKNVFFEENGNNPFSGYLSETNPFHESNPFNPFRDGDNNINNSDGQSEPESLTSNKEV